MNPVLPKSLVLAEAGRSSLLILGVLGLHALALWQINLIHPEPTVTVAPPWVITVWSEPPAPSPATHALPAAEPALRPTKPSLASAKPAPANAVPVSTMVKQLSVDPDRPAQTEIASSSATDSAARGVTPAGLAAPAPEGRAPVHNPAHNPARPTTQLPSSNADYLNNPPPIYPAISQRLGEQGKVLLRVLIGKNGSALRGDIEQSSGFERLDQAALRAAMQWRYVPGQRDGIAEDMWYTVPIVFGIRAE